MRALNESAKKAANGTYLAIRIGNLQFDEDPSETPQVELMVKGPAPSSSPRAGFEAEGSDIHVGLMPDLGIRVRYQAIVIAAPTSSVPPQLAGILDGAPEGIIQFHELPGVGSIIGDEKRGDLMAGFTKAPFHGAAYAKRGIAKGAVLMSSRVEYVSDFLKYFVAGVAKDKMNANQHEIGKLNAQLSAMTDGDEAMDLHTLKERKVNKGFAINRVLVHSGEYFTAYAEQTRMSDVRDAMVELTGIFPRSAQQGEIINIARFYGREMHVLTVLLRVGEVGPPTLTVLSTIWKRLKGMSGATFA